MSSFTRYLTFALVVGLLVTTAGAMSASEGTAAPAVSAPAQDVDDVEAASEELAACTVEVPAELRLPDPNPQLCPDEVCYADADCASYCPRGGDCVYYPSCPAPVCMCF